MGVCVYVCKNIQGVAIKMWRPGISQVLTLIVTQLDLFTFVCSFGVIISHSRFQYSKTSQKTQNVVYPCKNPEQFFASSV